MTETIIDFERHFGVNAGYVEELFQSWKSDPDAVDASWREVFAGLAPEPGAASPAKAPAARPAARPAQPAQPTQPTQPTQKDASGPQPEPEGPEAEPLRGLPARIAENMETSLELPTATSVRTIPVKVLDENRRILNEHMKVRALGKASYTHLVAFALARALAEMPRVQAAYGTVDGKPHRLTPRTVSLGLAIDVASGSGERNLVVPSLKDAQTLDFKAFHAAYEDIVRRGRDGKLQTADFQGTTATLTNPGGFGTEMSVPRLMKGQGLIVAIGAIGVPPAAAGMSIGTLSQLAIGPVMTVTSTYDHRVIQGAQSALLLKRLEALLQGEDGFYEQVFASMRVPWTPARPTTDLRRPEENAEFQAKAWQLINAYRVRGCYVADLDPLAYSPDLLESLDPACYGFTVWDLDREFLAGGMRGRQTMTLREILAVLRASYCRRWTVEYMHISNRDRKHWVRDTIESERDDDEFGGEARMRILTLLSRAENFERFLHTRYVGNKRFSLEGADTLIPALAEIIDRAAAGGVEKVVIGMAHRGRLNVLANILNKSYSKIFSEFEGTLLPLSSEGTSDVKYHLGQRGSFTTSDGRQVEVFLSANPSHLEAVDPVVCGMTRAWQDELGDTVDRRRVLSVLVHGDAAFSGQGVVAETLNMSALPAYKCGGTIHVVVNNQIGFTTGPKDLRSTYYCTDVAKSIQAPILHANGDYPESVLRAVRVAVDYRLEFGRDAVIDMVCYRRHGHNEGDEPAYTQPLLYERIKGHPTVRDHYTQLLIRRGALDEEQASEIGRKFDEELGRALEDSRRANGGGEALPLDEVVDLDVTEEADWFDGTSPDTGVPAERLVDLVDRTNRIPEGHATHPNLLRQLRRRETMVRGEQDLDWGCAEVVAFGSLLEDGVSIRLSGQDSARGTFSHRHSVIRDQKTEKDWVPLTALAEQTGTGATFETRDSLLSEEAVVGFEYGYAFARPHALVLWEAQFGDFVNGAQIPVDQFVVSGEAKWKQTSGLVMLLPHGYDGQGPEHSSARPERFLTLCSGGNITVVNCSTSAQYFHLLRRQGLAGTKRPLIVMTPKSLLRDRRAASPVGDLATGRFREVIGDPIDIGASGTVRRVVLCSGKVYHDLATRRAEREVEGVALVRLEQLYPLPRRALLEEIDRHGEAELVWCQEEPRNMGAWTYVHQRLADLDRKIRYVGRAESPSPATGSYRRHLAEQEHLVSQALEL